MMLRDPWWLLLLALVPWVVSRRWRRPAPAVRFSPAALFEGDAGPLPGTWRTRLAWAPMALQVVALGLIVVALARPVERVPLPVERQGIDVMLCLDVSSSMAQKDLDAQDDRLQVAKAAARRFVQGRPEDRIGLVRFARYCDVVCPPTLDHAALLQFLDGVELVEHEGDEDLTGIGGAVARTVQVLAGAASRSRTAILVTDGEENVANAGTPEEIGPLQAAQLARHHGVRVYTIAVGGDEVDTSQVRQLAERTGGTFDRARRAGTVEQIYRAIAELERAPMVEPRFRLQDRTWPWILTALLLVLLAQGLRGAGFEVVA